MTITTTTLRAQYNGNGVTTSFSVPFEFLEGSTVKVILTSVAGVDTVKTLTTHYTVTGGGTVQPATGSVVMITAPATGEKLTILRAQPLTQAASYTEGDAFPAKTHEKALDRQAMEVQMLAERTNRALKLKETSANSDLIFPEPEADKIVGWNAAGDELENKTVVQLGTIEILDEDDMASDSATKPPSQQSVKAYVDGKIIDEDDMASDSATKVPTQQSVKTYVDGKIIDEDDMASDSDTSAPTQQSVNRAKVHKAADQTALAALDGDAHSAVFVGADREQSQWVWDASDLSATLVGPAIASSLVTIATNNITSVAHGLFNRTPVIATTTTADITANTIYFAIKVDDDNYQLATSVANAQAGTEIDLTVTTAITVKRHFDPYSDRVKVKTGDALDGSDGGYVLAGGLSTGGYFSDDATPGRIGRFGGIVGIGDAAGIDMVRLHGNGNTGTWVDEVNTNYTYMVTSPQLVVGHVNGGTAISAYSRTSDSPGAGNDSYGICAAYQGLTVADKASNFAWTDYKELIRYDAAGSAFVSELEMTNLGTTTILNPKPYASGSGSHVAVLALGSGGGGHIQNDGPITGTPQNFSNYLHFTKTAAVAAHEARAYAGIVSYYNSLVRATPGDETTDADFARLARGHGIVAFDSSDVETARIRFFGATSSRRQVLQFGTTATQILGTASDGAEHAFLTIAIPSMGAGVGGNGITLTGTAAGGGAPTLSATGSDTNLMVNIRGKGSSGVQLQDGASATKIQITTTGMGFFGTAAVAKPTGVAVTAAGIHAALVTLGLIAA